jgi:hypothetical protein
MNTTLKLFKEYQHKIENYSSEESIKYIDFIDSYNIETINSLKVIRKERKSYLNFMFLLNLVFVSLYTIEFKWPFVLLHVTLYLISFLFFNQYDYFVKFSIDSEIKKIKISDKDHDLFNQLESRFYSKNTIPILFKNESSFKSYIRSKQPTS